MRIALVGVGTTGSHVARQLTQTSAAELILTDIRPRRLESVAEAVRAVAPGSQEVRTVSRLVPAAPPASGAPRDPAADPAAAAPTVVILAGPAGTHVELAEASLRAGSHVVSIGDDADEVTALLALDPVARASGRSLVVGAGFSPGLSCLLAAYAASQLDRVEVISVYQAGTGGPACARAHHRALKRSGHEWLDGAWVERRGGSGRDLAWFPEPFGARDCYRGALPTPALLQPELPDAQRISARMAATRRDRMTSRLPMLRPPHDDGGPGAIRVEVRGRVGTAVETVIMGVMDHPSVAAGTVAALAAVATAEGRAPVGAHGLAAWADSRHLLAELRRRGVRVASFGGRLEPLAG